MTLKEYGPFEYQEIEFEINKDEPNIHIFAGINGTGKSSILHSLACAFDYFETGHHEHISNKIYKRFWKKNGKFQEDEKEMANSYAHIILMDANHKVIDKIANYGCKNCGNIHQNFEKTVSHNLIVGKYGKIINPIHNLKSFNFIKMLLPLKKLMGRN